MKTLLPYRFKKIGIIITPLGLTLWSCMQLGYITLLLTGGDSKSFIELPVFYHYINIIIAIISFFSFWVGLYFIAFSEEKVEDEMIQKTRLDSIQFAASLQLITIITGFLVMIIYKEPKAQGMMLFFIAVLFVFWFTFIIRFNYILHIKINKYEEQHQGGAT